MKRRAPAGPPALTSIVHALAKLYGKPAPPPSRDPFQLVLWEQVGYLASDTQRAAAFAKLKDDVGLDPAAILRASPEKLAAVARAGGATAVDERATRMRRSAQRVVDEHGGDLKSVLSLPIAKAKKALQAFDQIGAPGAEKILLFGGALEGLPLESNGLRVLVRIGFGKEDAQYAKTYRSVQQAIANDLPREDALVDTHQLLRRHGQELCTRNRPQCALCPLSKQCAYAART